VPTAEIRNEARASRQRARSRPSPGVRGALSAKQTAEIEQIAGEELRRLGYALEHQPS
jgi:hypothetical protein